MRFKPISTFTMLVIGGVILARITAQAPADQIIFPHVLHIEDMGMDCGECHEGIEASQSVSHNLLPSMDFCQGCHDGDTAPEDCDICHTQPDEADTYTWQPTKGLIFPHQNHIQNDVPCRQCHPKTSEAEALTPRIVPNMNLCMDCHTTPLTDAGCYACHATLKGKLPATHDASWPETHGLFTDATLGPECAVCHQQTDCEDCHARTQLEKRVHPVNYEFQHAGDFLGFNSDCGTCHAMPQECQICHLAKGVMPISHNSAGWATLTDGGWHKEDALNQPDYCMACHLPASDRTCLRCHL
jgi:hypothetical protein